MIITIHGKESSLKLFHFKNIAGLFENRGYSNDFVYDKLKKANKVESFRQRNERKVKRILLMNGPNINMLGIREKEVYGTFTLQDIEKRVSEVAASREFQLDCFQSNHEGELIDRIQVANGKYAGIIFNPAAYTHTSIALRDAIKAIETPVIEVHISNVHKRETFRHTSIIAPACHGQIVGLGITGYQLAAIAFMDMEQKGV